MSVPSPAAPIKPVLTHPLNVIVATDCGSTTTKAILIEKVGDEYRQTYRGEAPTTVEAPFEDVTRGVLNAIAEIEELSGRKILDGDKILTPNHAAQGDSKTGVDIYISTSSAGGGLQMMVTGVVQNMTGESAQRAALGAGAIVIDVLASNDGRLPHEKIERIRTMRPDMILMSGGTDGGAVTHVVEMAEYISAAEPRPRFGATYKLPLIYAGNKDAQPQVKKILGEKAALVLTDNIRPVLERENLAPARNKIHDLFLEHVMQQAPGYKKLIEMAGAPIMPTPAAVGVIMETIAKREHLNLIGVDIGGPTTDVSRSSRDSSTGPSARTSGCRTVSPTCWQKQGWPISCDGCRSRLTNRRSAIGLRTRWFGQRRFRRRWTSYRSNMPLPAKRSGSH